MCVCVCSCLRLPRARDGYARHKVSDAIPPRQHRRAQEGFAEAEGAPGRLKHSHKTRVQDLGFRVQDLGFRVQDLGFRAMI